MVKINYKEFIENEKTKYIEEIDVIDAEEILNDVYAAGSCKWWNLSCRLGNKGAYCTLSVECMPTCH